MTDKWVLVYDQTKTVFHMSRTRRKTNDELQTTECFIQQSGDRFVNRKRQG